MTPDHFDRAHEETKADLLLADWKAFNEILTRERIDDEDSECGEAFERARR